MSKIPSDDISLYKLRIRESDHLKTVLELYDMEIHQKISMPNCQKLKTMVKLSIAHKLRLRNFDAGHGRIESGPVVKSRKGIIGVEGGNGVSHQWKEKGQCSQGDQCSFWHGCNDRAQKPEHTAATPSEAAPSRGRSVSRKRSIRGRCNHGSFLRKPCRLFEGYLHATGPSHRVLCVQCAPYVCYGHVFHLLSAFFFAFSGSLFSQQVMVPISSSASTASSIDDYSERNMWNPLLELLFLEHVNGIVDSYLVDLDLAMIALSCHFAIDLLYSKEEVLVYAR